MKIHIKTPEKNLDLNIPPILIFNRLFARFGLKYKGSLVGEDMKEARESLKWMRENYPGMPLVDANLQDGETVVLIEP